VTGKFLQSIERAAAGSLRTVSLARLGALAVLVCLAFWFEHARPVAADEWLPISPEELRMTSEPKAPGAPAIYLYRQVDRNDQTNIETDYVRIKILTEEGRKQADVELRYSARQGTIRDIKARTIHADGTIINFDGKVYDKTVVKARDLKYLARTFTLPDVQVGSIIEYKYSIYEDKQYVFFSHWVLNEDLFTRRAKFSVKLNEDLTSRWLGYRLPPGVALPKAAPDKVVRLEVADVPAYVEEEYSLPEDEVRAIVDFIYTDNRETDPASFWKSEGKKMNGTVENFVGRHKEIAQAAAEIAPPSDPPEVRLQKLYAKVQSLRNTDFEVEKTEQEKKREKAKEADNIVDVWKTGAVTGLQLTWLYLGLVRAAGFQAFPVALGHRDSYFFFPQAMNSKLLTDGIVLVKVNGADRFFDPGTAFAPFGMLPWYETAVKGLRLDKDGGTWIDTPLPDSSESRSIRKAVLKLDTHGTLSGTLTFTFTGLQALGMRIGERNEDDAQRKTYLEKFAQSSVPVGTEVELTNKPDWSGSSRELVADFNLKVPGWASGAGRNALLPVGLFSNWEKHMFEHSDRSTMVYFHYPYQTADDVTIELPAGWRVSSVPAAEKRDAGMLACENVVEDKGGSLHLTRRVSVNGIYVDSKNYPVLRAFFQIVKNADEQQIIVQPAAPGGGN
jgi:hypothetical protein